MQDTIVRGCEIAGLSNPNAEYKLLEKLHVKGPLISLPEVALPHLIDFTLEAARECSPSSFFALNPQMRVLTLKCCKFDGSINDIIQHLPNLQVFDVRSLTFQSNEPHTFDCFAQLKQLKRFECGLSLKQTIHILRALIGGGVQLEQLSLENIRYPDSIVDDICEMKSLTRLGPLGGCSDRNLIRFMDELSNLKDVQFVSVDEGSTICEVLRRATPFTKVHFSSKWRDRIGMPLLNIRLMDEINALRRKHNIDLRVDVKHYDVYLNMNRYLVCG